MKISFYNRSFNGGVGYLQTALGQGHFYSTAWQQFTIETEKATTAGYHDIIFKLYQPGGSFYIDDVKIEIIKDDGGQLMHAADYYPFGLAMAGNIKDSYRFGYHSLFRFFIGSEYAEDETEETGWNSFEARIACADSSAYDPVIGRWLSVDPARVGHSPYIGMANDPIGAIDPDGRKPLDWFKNKFSGDLVEAPGKD